MFLLESISFENHLPSLKNKKTTLFCHSRESQKFHLQSLLMKCVNKPQVTIASWCDRHYFFPVQLESSMFSFLNKQPHLLLKLSSSSSSVLFSSRQLFICPCPWRGIWVVALLLLFIFVILMHVPSPSVGHGAFVCCESVLQPLPGDFHTQPWLRAAIGSSSLETQIHLRF